MTDSTYQRATRALHMHGLAGTLIRELGQGLDHTAFRAGDLVVRTTDHRRARCEARLLAVVASHAVSLPVPAVCFVDEDDDVLAYPLLPGRSLLGRTPPPGTATRLGRFLRDLHAIDPSAVADLIPTEQADPGQWVDDLPGPADLVHIARATTRPPGAVRVVAHADLGAEHIEQDATLTGIFDWSDAAITDPALDFARLYRDFGAAFLAEALDAYGGLSDHDLPRIEFFARCAAVEDLAYGLTSGRTEYVHAAKRSLGWLFPAG